MLFAQPNDNPVIHIIKFCGRNIFIYLLGCLLIALKLLWISLGGFECLWMAWDDDCSTNDYDYRDSYRAMRLACLRSALSSAPVHDISQSSSSSSSKSKSTNASSGSRNSSGSGTTSSSSSSTKLEIQAVAEIGSGHNSAMGRSASDAAVASAGSGPVAAASRSSSKPATGTQSGTPSSPFGRAGNGSEGSAAGPGGPSGGSDSAGLEGTESGRAGAAGDAEVDAGADGHFLHALSDSRWLHHLAGTHVRVWKFYNRWLLNWISDTVAARFCFF